MDQKQAPSKPKNKMLKFLPKAAASGVYFHNPPYSPSKEKRLENAAKLKANGRRGFSGPLMIPDEARRRPRNGGSNFDDQSHEEEPTSPKVSCMGQIKAHKKQQIKKIKCGNDLLFSKNADRQSKAGLTFRKMLSSVNPRRKSRSVDHHDHDLDRKESRVLPDRAPSLSQMKRFASGRGIAFKDLSFDWEGDDERGDSDEEVRIAFSAPLTAGGGGADQFDHHNYKTPPLQPRKEINLWKRRTMAPPSPLELKPIRAN